MTRDRSSEMAVRMAWLRDGVPMMDMMAADYLWLRRASGLLVEETDANAAADSLVGRLPGWFRWVASVLQMAGLPLFILGLTSLLAAGFDDTPAFLGAWAVLAIIGSWAISEAMLRSGKAVAFVGLLPAWGLASIVAMEAPGPDLGIPMPPLWPSLAVGFLGGMSLLVRAASLAAYGRPAIPTTGVSYLRQVWRAGSTAEPAVAAMAEEIEDLSATRAESGRPLSELEWHDDGLIRRWPDAVDPGRGLRLVAFAVAAGVAAMSTTACVTAFLERANKVAITGDLVTSGGVIVAIAAFPGVAFLRRERWMAVALVAGGLSSLLLGSGLVLGSLDVVWAVIALALAGTTAWRLRPRLTT